MNYHQLINPWVITQAVLFATILLLPQGDGFEVSSELSVAFRLLGFLGWAILLKAVYDLRKSLAIEPVPSKNSSLQVNGIYRRIRHPMYLAVWFIFSGICVGRESWFGLALLVVLIVFFIAKSHYEEKQLIAKYPDYQAYMQNVGAFLPLISTNRTIKLL